MFRTFCSLSLGMGMVLLCGAHGAAAQDYNDCLSGCDQTYSQCMTNLEGYVYGDVPREGCRTVQQGCWDRCLAAESAPKAEPEAPAAQEAPKKIQGTDGAQARPDTGRAPEQQANPEATDGAPQGQPETANPDAHGRANPRDRED